MRASVKKKKMMIGKEWGSKRKREREREGNRRLKYLLKNAENEREINQLKKKRKLRQQKEKKELLKHHWWSCYIELTRVVERTEELKINLHIVYKTGQEKEKRKLTKKREKCIVKKQSSKCLWKRERDLSREIFWSEHWNTFQDRLNNIYAANRKKMRCLSTFYWVHSESWYVISMFRQMKNFVLIQR